MFLALSVDIQYGIVVVLYREYDSDCGGCILQQCAGQSDVQYVVENDDLTSATLGPPQVWSHCLR